MKPRPITNLVILTCLFSVSSRPYPENRKDTVKNIFTHVDEVLESYNKIQSPDINLIAYSLAVLGFNNMSSQGILHNDSVLTLIDYSLPSTEKRLYVIDIQKHKLMLKLHVAHGKNSGVNYAKEFSNRKGSNMSSLGFFVTRNTYSGKHGYSLRLEGIEASNNNALDRGIVIHGAYYVNKDFIKGQGRLGRSFGCPAISYFESKNLIDIIKNGSCVFIYYPDENYLTTSKILMLGDSSS